MQTGTISNRNCPNGAVPIESVGRADPSPPEGSSDWKMGSD